MTSDNMFKSIRWKFNKHKDLVLAGINHNILLDFFSRSYREHAFETWKKYPIRFAQESGCVFSEETPGQSLKEVYVEKIYDVNGFLPNPGDVVIDAGANYGDSAIWYAKCFRAKVFAFEPLEHVYEILKKNIQLNSVRIFAYNTPLGSGNEIRGKKEGSMFISCDDENSIKTKTSRLDDFTLGHVKLLKIDVEGFEMEVLQGAVDTIKKYKPKIIIETHSSDLFVRCNKLLSDLDYRISHFGRIIKSKNPGMNRVQNLFYSPLSSDET